MSQRVDPPIEPQLSQQQIDWVRGAKSQIFDIWRFVNSQQSQTGQHLGQPCDELPPGDPSSTHTAVISTGDPCFCGSDNCCICLDCGEENHD